MTGRKPKIAVLGSINMDLVATAPRIPKPGETIMGGSFVTAPGGKGANQAVAAVRLGAHVRMIGRVGDDVFGPTLLDNLRANRVNVDDVVVTPGTPSGIAIIVLDDNEQNAIVGIYGANMDCGEVQVTAAETALDGADALLLQMEIPVEVSLTAARMAHKKGVRVIFDPAPPSELPAAAYKNIDIIAPNQLEAEVLTGIKVDSVGSAQKAARELLSRGVGVAIVKLGEQGVVYADASGHRHIPAFEVEAVDTIAAGDAFAGGLAIALAEGQLLNAAVRLAAAAGALAVTKSGAQNAMPTRTEVEALLAG
jgi:ribokinase